MLRAPASGAPTLRAAVLVTVSALMLAGAAVLGLPAGASALSAHNYGGVSAALTLVDGSGPSHVRVELSGDRSEYVVSAWGVLEVGEGCSSVDTRSARCVRYGRPQVRAGLGAGDDRLELRSGGGLFGRSLHGGAGMDELLGGSGGDTLVGDAGADDLTSRRGHDRILGGPGRDALFGGRGPDRLHADDGQREAEIRCGRGKDLAVVDPQDPRPRGCERVRLAGD